MIKLRKSASRGFADHGWLKTYHTFSFADYYDPNFMGFGSLRVINDDYIDAKAGFPTHGHRNMEIITYLIEGAIEHRDSLNHSQVLRAGEVQVMTAGSGIYHSESNPLNEGNTHLLQIWVQPNQLNLKPGYSQKSYLRELEYEQNLVLISSPDGRENSLKINQNMEVYASRLKATREILFSMTRTGSKKAWIQLIKGNLKLNNLNIEEGDGVSIEDENEFKISSITDSEFILFVE